ncbi:hypothetical protein C0J52_07280 [Blattella germanica]|nr:hypothetical protein C0J52_07280 [Blattella germanica]
MIEPGFEDEIKSIEDLNDRHIPIAMEPPLEKLIELLDLKYEGKYVVQCPLYYKCTYDMFRYRNVSTFVERRFIEFIGTTIYEAPLNRGVRKNYCPIMSFGKFPLLMYFQKGDPLLDRFNVLIRRCLEGGFLDIFAVQVKTGTTLVELKNGFQAKFPLPTDEDKELLKQEDSTVYEVLRPSHFKTSFIFLLIGYNLSFIVCLLEWTYNKYS